MSEKLYAESGVDLAGAEAAKQRIAETVASTRTAATRGQVGAFGGMVAVPAGIERPLLVVSMDGVGTKVLVARAAGRYDTVGEDLVNHSVNDILVHGARPLAFLDYIAGAGLTVDEIARLVEGVARGCVRHAMTLAGGETAQMPGLYRPGEYDLAGTIIGVVAEPDAIHGDRIVPGDLLLAYESSGLHTNGYTLARRILFEQLGLGLDDLLPGLDQSVADALLAVHRGWNSGESDPHPARGLHGGGRGVELDLAPVVRAALHGGSGLGGGNARRVQPGSRTDRRAGAGGGRGGARRSRAQPGADLDRGPCGTGRAERPLRVSGHGA